MALTTEQRVRRAAVKLFAGKGFHGTGIRDLAREAGISSASLYHYMGTKEELLAEIMCECLDRLVLGAREVTDGVTDPRQRLASLVALHVLTHARRPAETRVVDHEVPALSAPARRRIVELRDEYEAMWADAIDDGIRKRCFATAEPGVTRLALLEMCTGVARWYSPRGALGLDQLADHYANLALRMLGCPGPDRPAALDTVKEVVTRIWRTTP